MDGKVVGKERFLKRISDNLKRDKLKSIETPSWKYNPQSKILTDKNVDELLNILKDQCDEIHTEFIQTNSIDLKRTLNQTVEKYGGGPIITWKDRKYETLGLNSLFYEEWPERGIEHYEWEFEIDDQNIINAERANVGITISDITLAESATAVLLTNKNRGRVVSFLPKNSIVLIPKS